jgi:putative redox protein
VAKPPVVADLTWLGDLRFQAVSRNASMTIDGDSNAGPSPVQALVFALAGCMAADLVFILTKGRHVVRSLRARLTAQRAQENPHRLLKVDLHFEIEGAVPVDAVQRAISLSREKYCSVWHSLNPDIVLQVTSDIRLPAQG